MNTISIQVSPSTHARIAKFRASNGGMTMEAALVLLLDLVETMESETCEHPERTYAGPGLAESVREVNRQETAALEPGPYPFSNLLPTDWKPTRESLADHVEEILAADDTVPSEDE